MQKPASLVPLKNIFLLWTESSDQSALDRPLSTWSEAEDAIHAMAKVAPEHGYGGRGDLCASLKSYGRGIWDLKSGKKYAVEHTLQLALLRFGKLAVYDDNDMLIGCKDMPEVETAGCVYVNADGTYDVDEYPADEDAFAQAVALLGVYNWTRTPEITKLRNAWRKK